MPESTPKACPPARRPRSAQAEPTGGGTAQGTHAGKALAVEATLDRSRRRSTRPQTTHDDLTEIETRCRRKGEAARWAAERLRRAREGNGFEVENPPMDPEMVEWADRLTDCFYWMNASAGSQPADLSVLDNVGGCFEAVAEALALVRVMLEEHPGNQKVLERSLPLVAEAQSGLRAAFQRLGAAADPDQLEVFEWLKATAARHHVYIKRFMRADEIGGPRRAGTTSLARIESRGGERPSSPGCQIPRSNGFGIA